jgi:hypothetical protein
MRMKFLPLLLGFCVFSAWGNISVTVNRSAKLFVSPTENSAILSQVSGKSPLRAIEQSEDKKWVFVSDGLRYGWIRKEFVTQFDESKAVVAQKKAPKLTRESVVSKDLRPRPNFSDDSDLPLDDESMDGGLMDNRSSSVRFAETIEDSKGEVFVVRKSGALYDKPLRNADQFGKIESDDRVEFLNLSNDENWVKVRVIETGEEGWLPRKDISRKDVRDDWNTINRISDRTTHLGVYGVFSPVPWSLGVLGTLSKTFNSLMIAETALELGAGLGYSVGNTYSQFLTVSYLDTRVFLRWEPHVSPKVTIPMELGLLYKRGIIRTTLSQSEFERADSRIKLGESGMLFGAGVSYVPNDIFKFIVMPKLQVTSSLDLILDAGVTYSF